MSDRSEYERGCEFVDDELTCTIEVSGASRITLKFKDECLYSCISKKLFNKIKKKSVIELQPITLNKFYLQNMEIMVLGAADMLIKLHQIKFKWRVLIIEKEFKTERTLPQEVILGADFKNICDGEARKIAICGIERTGLVYKMPAAHIRLCTCIKIPECYCYGIEIANHSRNVVNRIQEGRTIPKF